MRQDVFSDRKNRTYKYEIQLYCCNWKCDFAEAAQKKC